MFTITYKMLLFKRTRFAMAVLGIAFSFFLAASQVGLLVGWCNTNSAIIRNANVDLWIMAPRTPAFDYGTAIPRHRLDQARSVRGVKWAEALFMAWNIWHRPDGGRVNVELIGLDENTVGGPWQMAKGTVDGILLPDSVIVDELYLSILGINGLNDEVELLNQRARVRGISRGVRTFTASPFVFTSIPTAIKYDKRYSIDEITYILVKTEKSLEVESVKMALMEGIPHVEVLTTDEFALRSVSYWMLETGVGITVVLTAVLGLLFGAVITSQTLYAITNDYLSHYATMLALGNSRISLIGATVTQSVIVTGVGVSIGSALFFLASNLSVGTPIPLEITPEIFSSVILAAFISGACASVLSVRSILSLDPASVFTGE